MLFKALSSHFFFKECDSVREVIKMKHIGKQTFCTKKNVYMHVVYLRLTPIITHISVAGFLSTKLTVIYLNTNNLWNLFFNFEKKFISQLFAYINIITKHWLKNIEFCCFITCLNGQYKVNVKPIRFLFFTNCFDKFNLQF